MIKHACFTVSYFLKRNNIKVKSNMLTWGGWTQYLVQNILHLIFNASGSMYLCTHRMSEPECGFLRTPGAVTSTQRLSSSIVRGEDDDDKHDSKGWLWWWYGALCVFMFRPAIWIKTFCFIESVLSTSWVLVSAPCFFLFAGHDKAGKTKRGYLFTGQMFFILFATFPFFFPFFAFFLIF